MQTTQRATPRVERDAGLDEPGWQPRGGTAPKLDAPTLAALKNFIAGVFAHVPGKTMQIGRLLNRQAAEDFLRKCQVG